MIYLIVQIWLYIAVAAAIGLLFGWMFRGGAASVRLRELHRELDHAQRDAGEQRREAAELAARAERKHSAGPSPEVARLQGDLKSARERIMRLESEAREAGGAADRYAEEAEELRRRISDLMTRSGGAGADERAAWRARMGELEEEAESLRRRLDQRESEAATALQQRIKVLEGEGDALRAHVQQLLDRSTRETAAAERMAELESEASALRTQLEKSVSGVRAEAGAQIDALEAERDVLLRRIDEAAEAASAPLRDRVAELEHALNGAETAVSAAQDSVREAAAAEMEALAQELIALKADADRLRDELDRRDAQAQEQEQMRDQMRQRIGELEAHLDISRQKAAAAEQEVQQQPSEPQSSGGEDLRVESARLSWRNRYLTSRIHFLESQLREEEARRTALENAQSSVAAVAGAAADGADPSQLVEAHEEIARLSAKVADLEKAAAAIPDKSDQPAPNVEGGGGSLEWRNRYLASRVRYLEQRLEELNASGRALGDDDLRQKLAQAQEELREMARLRARVGELEREVEHAGNGVDKSEGDRAQEWRIRYLSSRVKYLEDRLAKEGAPPESAEVD
jgi:chromosome segregation ATPase